MFDMLVFDGFVELVLGNSKLNIYRSSLYKLIFSVLEFTNSI